MGKSYARLGAGRFEQLMPGTPGSCTSRKSFQTSPGRGSRRPVGFVGPQNGTWQQEGISRSNVGLLDPDFKIDGSLLIKSYDKNGARRVDKSARRRWSGD